MSTVANSSAQVLKLNSRRGVAERTMAFEFTKPLGFEFKAGQFAEITWIDPPETDAEGNARAFSIASAPYEDRLMFTTRLYRHHDRRKNQKKSYVSHNAGDAFPLEKNRL